jgi:hypothetical protein
MSIFRGLQDYFKRAPCHHRHFKRAISKKGLFPRAFKNTVATLKVLNRWW